ncbi:hypothetical protein [Morganella morganii IS15]|nr:hypothetical protein [Morganella morganii IS15]
MSGGFAVMLILMRDVVLISRFCCLINSVMCCRYLVPFSAM